MRTRVRQPVENKKHTGKNTGKCPEGTHCATAGSALLAVLWLVAGLSAIAFSLATTVRGEAERTSTAVDGVRSYYLATGAIQRAILYMQWSPTQLPDGRPRYYAPGTPAFDFQFASGVAHVEIIPETAKLNINLAPPEDLFRVLTNLGMDPNRAREIVLGIVDWRTAAGAERLTEFDQFYLSLSPSFRARHASFEEIEELLLIKGMTPDLFYGTYDRDEQGRLFPRPGAKECLSVFGATDRFDANTAQPAVLGLAGLSPEMVAALIARRRVAPFRTDQEVAAFMGGANRLRIGGNSIFTLRATAQLRLPNGQLSDLRRTAAALVKFMPPGYDATIQILRWYDNAWNQ